MSIEVKQLIIKSTIVNTQYDQLEKHQSNVDLEKLKSTIIEVCNDLIAENSKETRER